MTDINTWMTRYVEQIKGVFGKRVVFLGLQGSRAHGEAREDSDIDAVCILDHLGAEDINLYGESVSALPRRDLLCGFISGKAELENWEPSDLFQFYHDTLPYEGSLDFLLPKIRRCDIERAVRLGACNLYHATVHNLIHEKDSSALPGLYKSAGFILQAIHFLNTGVYVSRKADLLPLLSGINRDLMETGLQLGELPPHQEADLGRFALPLFEWSGALIRQQAASALDASKTNEL